MAIPRIDDATAVSISRNVGCVLRERNSVACWGNTFLGARGNRLNESFSRPGWSIQPTIVEAP